MKTLKTQSPYAVFLLLAYAVFPLCLISRCIFWILSPDHLTASDIIVGLLFGLVFDFSLTFYMFLPFALLGLLPRRVWDRRSFQTALFALFTLEVSVVAWCSVSEVFFIQEFHSRFNFIAVDYLVYSNEVLKNLWESFPLGQIAAVFLAAAFLGCYLLFKIVPSREPRWAGRPFAVFGLLAFLLALAGVTEHPLLSTTREARAEFAKNPVHALFAAYRNNEIEYEKFYPVMREEQAAHLVHEDFEEDTTGLSENEGSDEDETSVIRNIKIDEPERRLNVVLVLMESMSARFMQTYGATESNTPNLDDLAGKSGLSFEKIYATGTRTVRGIEATILSIPPTPGQSVVRRPDGGQIFNVGEVFRQRSYKLQFLYGGRALFDNMGTFFSTNGFEVIDESPVSGVQNTFSNAWGLCDEDLFAAATRYADLAAGQPFFQVVLTASNHRPYTYPEGRVAIKPGTGRTGAIQYADYAIGEYLRAARAHPWFKDTVFVFVADHNASVAGGSKILPSDYHIPVIFYSPDHIMPQKRGILGSQIDVAPTLLGLLNFSYQSRFFGHDLMRAKTERAFIATYQKIGLLQDRRLAILSPTRKAEIYKLDDQDLPELTESFTVPSGQTIANPLVRTAAAYYQTASYWYGSKLLKNSKVFSLGINPRSQ